MTPGRFSAVLFDRDGTLIDDVPYNGDPAAVRPMPGAVAAVARLRAAGLRLGVISNQSGIARGYLTAAQHGAVRDRIAQIFGSFDTWRVCPHDDAANCPCRKPRPGLVVDAARDLGVALERCVVVGDIGSDVAAAQAAGAVGLLVPTPRTRPAEVAAAPLVLPDLAAVAAWILGAQGETAGLRPPVASGGLRPLARTQGSEFAGTVAAPAPAGRRVLLVRADSAGDVLLTGPAVRAVAARAGHVALLCGPRGRAAAELLPGVDAIIEWTVPWLDPLPPTVDGTMVDALVKQLAQEEFDQGIIFTSYHQSALPTALLLRLAGVAHLSAISDDYPGSLLDVRLTGDPDIPEAERAVALAGAAGYPLPALDDGLLRLKQPLPPVRHLTGADPYVVVHPGASVPARSCPPDRLSAYVAALTDAGHRVIVTGAAQETPLTAYVAGGHALDLGGRTTLAELAAVLAGAECAVVANTGPAHVAAALGTPVVSLFAPTVPYERWRPYGVPVVRLGDPTAPCRNSRASLCPVPGHPCLSNVDTAAVVAAVARLAGRSEEAEP